MLSVDCNCGRSIDEQFDEEKKGLLKLDIYGGHAAMVFSWFFICVLFGVFWFLAGAGVCSVLYAGHGGAEAGYRMDCACTGTRGD